jgi:hypothetical protein
MGSTSYSTDLGIKLIGTGLEAGTWGASTNQNFKRVEDAIGLAVTLDLTSMPTSSTSSTALTQSPSTAVWLVIGNADSDAGSSESDALGRACAVEFTDGGTATYEAGAAAKVEIRGALGTTNVNRTYIVRNTLTEVTDLIIDCGTGTMILKHGYYAMVNLNPDGTGSWGDGLGGPGVHNLLSKLQLDTGLAFTVAANVEFDAASTITVPAATASAIGITDGTTTFIDLDTDAEKITLDSVEATGPVNIVAGDNKLFVEVPAFNNEAMKVWDGVERKLSVDTVLSKVVVGQELAQADLQVWGDILLDDVSAGTPAAHSLIIPDALDPAFSILSTDASEYLNILSSAEVGDRRIDIKVPVEAPDISVTGADGYIEFGSSDFDGATGIGIRNNSSSMEHRVDASAAWNPIVSALVGVDIAAADTQAILAATSADGEEQMGCIDIGPIRLIFNTVFIANSLNITLGDEGSGTDAAMYSALWSVMLTSADQRDTGANQNATCKITGSAAGTFTVNLSARSDYVTYWAIGDSGA